MMTRIGVLAHAHKDLDGGLDELRRRLAEKGVSSPVWREITDQDEVAPAVAQLREAGVERLLVWGGDGTVRRCIDAARSASPTLAILPAGTANLLAANLGVPADLEAALSIALSGRRERIDLGVVNGERFAVMAGTGFYAQVMEAAEGDLKDRFGRVGYVAAGVAGVRREAVQTRVDVDGATFFRGPATCVLVGNMGKILGGVAAFPEASAHDGLLDVGVVTAEGAVDWGRLLASTLAGRGSSSPFAETLTGRTIEVELAERRPYELDGDVRPETRHLTFRVEPAALDVCVPAPEEER